MKKGVLFFLFILILPFAFADITITTDQNIYNLGNKIKASASVLQSNNFEGLFKLAISCETEKSQSFSGPENSQEFSRNYKLQYFLTPISLEANFRTAVNVPELVATESMLGNCKITGDIVTNDNIVIEEKESNNFGVTNQLFVLPVKSKVTAFPSDKILISGVLNEAFGNNVLKASTKISLDNYSHIIDTVDGKFNLTIKLQKNIKSGKHAIEISASDSKNNFGSYPIELEVTAIPTSINIGLSSDKLLPGSKIEIIASLYDQAGDLINESLDLELTDPAGNKVFRKIVQSSEKIDYEFSQYAEPENYILASTYKNLITQTSINITTIREVKIKYENETVFIENIGNVPFEDELTFILESELKKYPVIKKITIEPSKVMSIDLSKEMPLGVYDVKIPIKEGLEPIKEKVEETVQNIVETAQESLSSLLQQESVLAANVTIHDNRPFYKKITGSLSSIQARLVGANGLVAKNPILAPTILLVILLLLIFRYGRKLIMRMIKGKKDDENKNQEN